MIAWDHSRRSHGPKPPPGYQVVVPTTLPNYSDELEHQIVGIARFERFLQYIAIVPSSRVPGEPHDAESPNFN